jgi:2-oxoglutarate ferredoxin oxidoreductase subunit gamma
VKEIVFAGFGGQGVLTSGLALAYIAMKHDYDVLWSPAYGAAMRGGKAYSIVKFANEPIDGPILSELDVLVALNHESLEYVSYLKDDGLLIVNADIVEDDVKVDTKAKTIRMPVATIAENADCSRSANVVPVGYLVKTLGIFDKENAIEAMCGYFESKGKGKFNDGNVKAFNAGYDYQA